MPSKPIENGDAASSKEVHSKKTEELLASIDEHLATIAKHTKRVDNRDRLQMWTAIFRWVIHIIPTLIVLYGGWYIYNYGDDLLREIISRSAREAANITQERATNLIDDSGVGDVLDQLQQYFGGTAEQ